MFKIKRLDNATAALFLWMSIADKIGKRRTPGNLVREASSAANPLRTYCFSSKKSQLNSAKNRNTGSV